MPKIDLSIFQFKVTGCIDGTHVKISDPGTEDAIHCFNRKGFMSLNVQAVCDADLYIMDLVARWAGSVHDSRIFHESRLKQRYLNGELHGWLLGDSGYPCLPFLMTPVLQGKI